MYSLGGVTSLSLESADAARLNQLVRSHWEIESGLHYRRDVTLGEDACRARTGASPQVFAALRNLSIGFHQPRRRGLSLAALLDWCCANFVRALELVHQHEF